MGELQLKDDAGDMINTSAMAHWADHTVNGNASACSDSNPGSYWQFSVADCPNNWIVDLGVSSNIRTLVAIPLYGYNRNMKAFKVYGSQDNSTYIELFSGQTTSASSTDTFTLNVPPAPANYLASPRRDRFCNKSISKGIRVLADNNPSFLVMRRNRLRTVGVSLEAGKPLFMPSMVPGLLARYSVTDIAGLNDADPATTWTDISGNGKDFTGAGTARPLYKTGILNGYPALLFDGSNDVMDSVSISGVKSICVVAKYTGATFANYNGLITGANIWLIGNAGTADFYPSDVGGAKIYKDGAYTSAAVTNAWHVFIITSTAGTNVAIKLGNDRGYGGRFWAGYVTNIDVYSTVLTALNIADLTAYYKAKYAF